MPAQSLWLCCQPVSRSSTACYSVIQVIPSWTRGHGILNYRIPHCWNYLPINVTSRSWIFLCWKKGQDSPTLHRLSRLKPHYGWKQIPSQPASFPPTVTSSLLLTTSWVNNSGCQHRAHGARHISWHLVLLVPLLVRGPRGCLTLPPPWGSQYKLVSTCTLVPPSLSPPPPRGKDNSAFIVYQLRDIQCWEQKFQYLVSWEGNGPEEQSSVAFPGPGTFLLCKNLGNPGESPEGAS